MWYILRQRSHDSIYDITETLRAMALDARLMPGTPPAALSPALDARIIRSSASTPSLRSRDGTVPMASKMDAGGNVRVVVRVRAFLQRGKQSCDSNEECLCLYEKKPKLMIACRNL